MKRACLFLGLLLLACAAQAAEPFTITDEFVAYIQQGANPQGFGLAKDGRFYPYSTSLGRRIAWRQAVADKAWFAAGWPKADAVQQLRTDLDRALAEARQLVARQQPARSFDALPRAAQEMLVDFIHSEGATNIAPAFVTAVLAGDRPRLI